MSGSRWVLILVQGRFIWLPLALRYLQVVDDDFGHPRQNSGACQLICLL